MQFKFFQNVEIGVHKFPRGVHSVPPSIQADAYFKACMVSGLIVSLETKSVAAPVKTVAPIQTEMVDKVQADELAVEEEAPVKEEKKSKKKSKKE